MSDIVFKPCAGAAVVSRGQCTTGVVKIEIDNKEIAKELIVTGMTLEMSGNYQVLHTVGSLIYFYAFGDRIGTLNINGIGFIGACDGAKQFDISAIYAKYNAMKAVKKSGKAVKIVISSGDDKSQQMTLWGFLTGFRADVADSQMGVIGHWSMRFEVAPDST